MDYEVSSYRHDRSGYLTGGAGGDGSSSFGEVDECPE